MSGIEHIELLFHQALALPPGPERTRWVEAQRQGNSDMWPFGDPASILSEKSLGGSYLMIQQLDRAQSHLESALATFEELGDDKEIAATLRLLAQPAVWQGRLDRAIQLYERALRA